MKKNKEKKKRNFCKGEVFVVDGAGESQEKVGWKGDGGE